ncbi:MAG: hypothetical protein PW735_11610 [Acidobacteriaceae bacterium]|nr:hypothetical protein [Acidobacteriaceae bacterium]
MIHPTGVHLLYQLSERLRTDLTDDERGHTRKTIGKLALHFFGPGDKAIRRAAQAAIEVLVAQSPDDKLVDDLLSTLAAVAKLPVDIYPDPIDAMDMIVSIDRDLQALIVTMEGKQ